MTARRSPAALILFAIAAGLAQLAGAGLDAPAAAATIRMDPAVLLLLGNPRAVSDARAKGRCEARLIDFVELMWPVLDPGQPFVRGWVQEAICLYLEAVTDGRITKLLVNVCPGFTKSRLVNVMWPAWEWGPRNRPDLRYMAWSYSADLSESLNEDCRKIIKSDVYQRLWGDRFKLDDSSDAKSYFKNDKGGWRRSSSVGGAGTGYRADRLLSDDPHNVRDAHSEAKLRDATRWFAQSLPTRARNLSGDVRVRVPFWVREVHGLGLDQDPADARPVTVTATVVIMQRVHLHDTSGVILRNPALGYEVLLIEMRYKGDQHPARKLPTWRSSSIGWRDPRTEYGELADPIRFPLAKVVEIETQMMLEGGSDAVAAQFDQWPLEQSGAWFRVEWLPVVDPQDVPADVPCGKRGWDFGGGGTSPGADPTACARVARGTESSRFYLWDTAAKRGSPGDVEAFITQQHADDERSVDWSVPEDPGTGKLFADYVVRVVAAGRYVHTSPEQKHKVDRAKPVSAQAQHGNFVIVRHPGWELARQELVDFPYGDHDDIVDAISRAFAACVAMPAATLPHGGYGGVVR